MEAEVCQKLINSNPDRIKAVLKLRSVTQCTYKLIAILSLRSQPRSVAFCRLLKNKNIYIVFLLPLLL